MIGFETMTDDMVQAAAKGSASARERPLELVASRVRAMIVARLSPSPGQFHAVDDLTQQALLARSEGLVRMRRSAVGALHSFASVIVSRVVARFLHESDPGRAPGVASLDSSLHGGSASGLLRELVPTNGLSPSSAAARAEESRHAIAELSRRNARRRVRLL